MQQYHDFSCFIGSLICCAWKLVHKQIKQDAFVSFYWPLSPLLSTQDALKKEKVEIDAFTN